MFIFQKTSHIYLAELRKKLLHGDIQQDVRHLRRQDDTQLAAAQVTVWLWCHVLAWPAGGTLNQRLMLLYNNANVSITTLLHYLYFRTLLLLSPAVDTGSFWYLGFILVQCEVTTHQLSSGQWLSSETKQWSWQQAALKVFMNSSNYGSIHNNTRRLHVCVPACWGEVAANRRTAAGFLRIWLLPRLTFPRCLKHTHI